jgi:hypothetical protein
MGNVGNVLLYDNPSQSVKQSATESKKHWLTQSVRTALGVALVLMKG